MLNKKVNALGLILVLLISLAAAAWSAVNVNWMAGFPMRLPGAGVMGMTMPVPGATSYKVMRMVEGASWEVISTVQVNNFSDMTAPTDKDVSYKVIAVVGGADAGETPVVVLKGEKPIQPPTNLTHRLDPENKTLLFRWESSQGASFYNVYRSEKEGDAGSLLASVQDTRYTDANIQDGGKYWYVVTSVSTTSKESVRPEPYKVDVVFPKVVKAKVFTYNPILMEYVATTWGEGAAPLKNPSDILVKGGNVFVACEDGVQVLDMEGNFVRRMPIIQENLGTGERWARPWMLSASPAGNVYVGFLGENIIREITNDGLQVVSTLVLPPLVDKTNTMTPLSVSIAVDPEGNKWVTDENYSNVAVVPPGAGEKPKPEVVTRIGFARGGEKYDEAKHGLALINPTRIDFIEDLGLIAVLEGTRAQITFLDPKTKKAVNKILGMGGNLNLVSACGDFTYYDKNTILVVDALNNQLKLIKVGASAADETNGDYIANLIDDDSPEQKAKLVNPIASVVRIGLAKQEKKLFLLSLMGNEVYIYKLP